MSALFHSIGITDVWQRIAATMMLPMRRIATFASKMAGMFLIGFGTKLTTN